MNLKNKKGITIIALVITVVIMLILVGVTIKVGTKSIDESEKEDIITNMISIKTRAKIVKDQFNFKDISSLVGTKFTDDTKYEKTNLNPAIPEEQKNNCYIWTQEDLNNQGLSSINSDESKFYVVYYVDNNTEVYYSIGVDGKYSLTDLQGE